MMTVATSEARRGFSSLSRSTLALCPGASPIGEEHLQRLQRKGEDVDARDGRDAHGLSVSRHGLQKTLKSRQ